MRVSHTCGHLFEGSPPSLLPHTFQEHSLVPKLFGPLRERYLTRPGGYTRLLRIPNRQGDNAKMAIIELVDNE